MSSHSGTSRANAHHGPLLDAIAAGGEVQAADTARQHVVVDVV